MKNVFLCLILVATVASASSAEPQSGDFQTHQSGNWYDGTTWERFDGTAWIYPAPHAPTYLDGAVVVLAGHTVVVNADVTVDSVVVDGNLVVASGAILAVTAPSGTERGVVEGPGGSITVNGYYKHDRDGGRIPAATWSDGSTCLITGCVSNTPGNTSQNFYHFVWNCPSQIANSTMAWNGNTIRGNITCSESGGQQCRLTRFNANGGNPVAFTIDGNVIVDGGHLTVTGSSEPQLYTVHHHGNIDVTGGSFGVSRSSTGDVDWLLYNGDVSVVNASFRSSSQPENPPGAKLHFLKSGTQTLNLHNVTWISDFSLFTFFVHSGTTLNLINGSRLVLNQLTKIDGPGNFAMEPATTLECRHQNGTDGNIVNGGTKLLPSNANYVLSGLAAQTTGSLLPSVLQNLTINNPNGVTLTGSTTVNGELILMAGTLLLGSSNLIANTIGDYSPTDYVVTDGSGALSIRNIGGTDVFFPVGTVSSYNPVTINNTGTVDDFSVRVKPEFDNALVDPSKAVNRQWTIAEAAPGGTTATLSLGWGFGEEASLFNRSSEVYIGRFNGSLWEKTSAAVTGDARFAATAAGFTGFSNFGVGNEGAFTATTEIQFSDPSFSASVFYNDIPWPDGIAVVTDSNLLVVNEADSLPGVFRAFEYDWFSGDDAFSTLGAPFVNPDDITRYPDGTVFVADGQAQAVFRIPAAGGAPTSFVNPSTTGSPDFNPFGVAIAPAGFDGPNVNPGDLIVADNAYGSAMRAVWAVNPNSGAASIIAQADDFTSSPVLVSFAPDGMLFVVQNVESAPDIIRIDTLTADGAVGLFITGIHADHQSLAINPQTGELFFRNQGQLYRMSRSGGIPQLFASNIGFFQDIEFNAAGDLLFVSVPERRQVIKISGPFLSTMQSLSLTVPNGGEIWNTGTQHGIRWTSSNVTNVRLELTSDDGSTWSEITSSTPAGLGTFTWTVPDALSVRCRVKASNTSDASVFDQSDNPFSIFNISSLFRATPNNLGITSTNGQFGCAWGDYDADGDLDLYITGNPNEHVLYRNDGGAHFTDVSVQSGLIGSSPVLSYGAVWADFDGDGSLDLLVTDRGVKLYKNDNGIFTDISELSNLNTVDPGYPLWQTACGDYDKDGDLDIALSGANPGTTNPPIGLPSHLLKNENGFFADVAPAMGINDVLESWNPAWVDVDNDGDLDLWMPTIRTPGERCQLFINDGSTLVHTDPNVTGLQAISAITSSWADFDNDGDMDVFLVPYVNDADGVAKLYRNNGDGTFTDIAPDKGLNQGFTDSRSVNWGDYDNDGDQDLLIGARTGAQKLYRSENAGQSFTEVGAETGAGINGLFRSAVFVDYDNDGFLDIYYNEGVATGPSAWKKLLLHNSGNSNHWIVIKPIGVGKNTAAIGARVTLVAGSLRQVRDIQAGGGGITNGYLWAHFGLGSSAVADSVIIQWPDGDVDIDTNVPSDEFYAFAKGSRAEVLGAPWRMQVKADIGGVSDHQNFAGVANHASDGNDVDFDLPEPPPSPGNYVSVYFPHPEWGNPLGERYAQDIRANSSLRDTVKRWYFAVQSNVVGTVGLAFIAENIPQSLGRYLTDLATGVRTNLRTTDFVTYENSTEAPHPFMLAVGDSMPPQVMLVKPNGGEIWQSGTTKTIQWHSHDRTGVQSTSVLMSNDGKVTYAAIAELGNEQNTDWLVPAEYLNHNYSAKIVVRDSMGNIAEVESARLFTVVGNSLSTTSPAGWSLISLPLEPFSHHPAQIFGDDILSPYYLWAYDQSTGYFTPTSLNLGTGYLLGLGASATWDVQGTAVEEDSTLQDLSIGFTMIGTNFVREFPKEGVSFIKDGLQHSFAEAVSNGLLVNALYGYEGGSYVLQDHLVPFKGYWLGLLQTGVQMVQKPVGEVAPPSPKIAMANQSESDWEMPLAVSTQQQRNNVAAFGVRRDATDEFDVVYDLPSPPRVPSDAFLELYFTPSGKTFPSILGNKYIRDFRGTSCSEWSLTIEWSGSGAVTIHWDSTVAVRLADSVQLTLVDEAILKSTDMAARSNYTFVYSGPRNFTIGPSVTSAKHSGKSVPEVFALDQNYPNPFNPMTTISYDVPIASFVRITVYDVLGKEITTLVKEEQEAGYYTVQWNARNWPSGVYFCRMIAGEFSAVKKLLLVK
jgi:hypothetical protein